MTEDLNKLWRDGVMVKIIAKRLNISPRAVRDRVYRLRTLEGPEIWPYRNTRFGNGKQRTVDTSISMPEDTMEKIQARAAARGITVSAYIRQLIEADHA